MKTIKIIGNKILVYNSEPILWIAALVYLALIDPYAAEHLNLCFFDLLGFEFCPGCGLGRSISMILRGDLLNSFACHPLGVPALVLIVYRIIRLFINKMTFKSFTEGIENG